MGSAGSTVSSVRLLAEGYKGIVDSSTICSVSPRMRRESTGRGSSCGMYASSFVYMCPKADGSPMWDLPHIPVAFPQH